MAGPGNKIYFGKLVNAEVDMVYPCGKLEDLCKYNQNTILRCGYLIGREKTNEENIVEENKCHI